MYLLIVGPDGIRQFELGAKSHLEQSRHFQLLKFNKCRGRQGGVETWCFRANNICLDASISKAQYILDPSNLALRFIQVGYLFLFMFVSGYGDRYITIKIYRLCGLFRF